MKLITDIVLGLMKLALVIGFAGGLVDATIAMKKEAVQTQARASELRGIE